MEKYSIDIITFCPQNYIFTIKQIYNNCNLMSPKLLRLNIIDETYLQQFIDDINICYVNNNKGNHLNYATKKIDKCLLIEFEPINIIIGKNTCINLFTGHAPSINYHNILFNDSSLTTYYYVPSLVHIDHSIMSNNIECNMKINYDSIYEDEYLDWNYIYIFSNIDLPFVGIYLSGDLDHICKFNINCCGHDLIDIYDKYDLQYILRKTDVNDVYYLPLNIFHKKHPLINEQHFCIFARITTSSPDSQIMISYKSNFMSQIELPNNKPINELTNIPVNKLFEQLYK